MCAACSVSSRGSDSPHRVSHGSEGKTRGTVRPDKAFKPPSGALPCRMTTQ
ncbi:hypothetical protein KCP77_05655 [Salmonella enterica subsp. enterica]|nr:hypothetical protein KCP77_05655 [Salmonella enterica subsp. enterica]